MRHPSPAFANGIRALCLACACLASAACGENPATGKRELALISEEQEIQIGRQAAEQTRTAINLVQNDALQKYVQQLGSELAAGSERPQLPWSFQVVDDATPNAFALPGGFIFVTRGMLTYMDSEAELAAVLSHEIAHVTARHSVRQISRAQLAQLGLGLGMVLFPEIQSYAGLLSSGLQLLFLKHGRDAERQADELGFNYALKEGYDVREMDDVFATLQSIAQQEGQSPLPVWASTHPDPGERIKTVQRRLEGLQSPESLQLGRDELMTHIDGLVFGTDPRHGYFENNRFLHPDLAFQIEFPQGWRTQNLPQAVMAGSPQQDGVIQLTLAAGEPEPAARRFLTQEGVRAEEPAAETVNGLPALLARFQAQTQGGAVAGIAGFIAHGERTYQIVGFAPDARYADMESTFRQSIGSFSALRDRGAVAVQPRRVDVVRLPRPMSLNEFVEAYPSAVEIGTLALINQVSDPGKTLPAGTVLKRVTGSKR
jgi:predicted Zn-dependent protease